MKIRGESVQTIVVLLKQTFDTEEKMEWDELGKIDSRDAKLVINPYDEYALEEAVRQKEKHGGTIIALTCGNERTEEALRAALAIGADEAIRLEAGEELLSDSYALAAVLASALAQLKPDLVLAGLFSVDSGSGSVALQAAEHLGIPHVSAAVQLDIYYAEDMLAPHLAGAKRYAAVKQDIEGDNQLVTVPLPALITAQQGLNEPRYPSLPNIMKAKRKPLISVPLHHYGLLDSAIQKELSIQGEAAANVTQSELESGQLLQNMIRTKQATVLPKPERAAGIQLQGDASEQAAALLAILQEKGVLQN